MERLAVQSRPVRSKGLSGICETSGFGQRHHTVAVHVCDSHNVDQVTWVLPPKAQAIAEYHIAELETLLEDALPHVHRIAESPPMLEILLEVTLLHVDHVKGIRPSKTKTALMSAGQTEGRG